MTSTDEKFWHAYIENFKTLKKICQRMHTKQKCKSNFSIIFQNTQLFERDHELVSGYYCDSLIGLTSNYNFYHRFRESIEIKSTLPHPKVQELCTVLTIA